MFCPQCGAEYREGFDRCADCDVVLVHEPLSAPEDQYTPDYAGLVEVYSTFNPGEIAFIKSVLEGEGIHYYFQGENPAMMVAAGAYARLLVRSDQADLVRDILRDLESLKA